MDDPWNAEPILAVKINAFQSGMLDSHFTFERARNEDKLEKAEKGSPQAYALNSQIQLCDLMLTKLSEAIREYAINSRPTPAGGENDT